MKWKSDLIIVWMYLYLKICLVKMVGWEGVYGDCLLSVGGYVR